MYACIRVLRFFSKGNEGGLWVAGVIVVGGGGDCRKCGPLRGAMYHASQTPTFSEVCSEVVSEVFSKVF